MYLSDIRTIIESLAVVTTICQFLSGILVCKQYVANRTTGEASPLPFTCGMFSCSLWLLYGLTKDDGNMIIVNLVGVILMVAYTTVFYVFTFKKSLLLRQAYTTIALCIFAVGYVNVEEDNEVLLSRLGISACSLTLLAVASPMSKLMYVIRTKSSECLPFPMIFMSFLVSSLWFFYGIIEEDVYLTIPNFIGAALALAQLSLFILYPSKPSSPLLPRSTLA
ncbi:sugar transporter SWEET1 [Colias croceus]|uniref:sugar transporter SWEET1 n=1 Tax=Colias crocea TaxID=72248 RepID=UPI001E2817D6|nr:sugar transporter SWEET1 [Colias croceus]